MHKGELLTIAFTIAYSVDQVRCHISSGSTVCANNKRHKQLNHSFFQDLFIC